MQTMQDWKEKAQDVHDFAKALGATCETHKAAKKGMKTCPHCGDDEQKEGAEKCTKCEKDMTEKKKAAKPETVKGKAPSAKDDEEDGNDDESTDGDDDNEDDDEGGSDNPKKPAKKKKKAASFDAASMAAAVAEGVKAATAPLQKSLEDLQTAFTSLKKNPPLPGTTPVATAISKTGDQIDNPNEVKKVEPQKPEDVLKGILAQPRRITNSQ